MKKTLIDWLNYMQSIHVSAIDMGLSRVIPVAEHLNLFDAAKKCYIFTVAGTNGKGSTTAVIAEICKQAGYKTALYQSPHLINFNERVNINGIAVSDTVLIRAFEQVEAARLACNLTLSFFEMTTLAAFLIFSQSECDVWVLEIGLGGRLDVVNIIDPDVAVITNIDVDHTDWLGDDIEKIGFEKAGILRKNIPFVYGSSNMPASIKAHSESLDAQCYQRGIDYNYYFDQKIVDNNKQEIASNYWQYSNAATTFSLTLPSVSLVNTSNAITAILISKLQVSQDAINQSLATVKLYGRFDYRHLHNRQWLFDVAHNKAGVEFTLSQLMPKLDGFLNNKTDENQINSTNLTETVKTTGKVHIILSMLKDKDIDTVINLLATSQLPITHWYIAPIDKTYCPRAASLDDLSQSLHKALCVQRDLSNIPANRSHINRIQINTTNTLTEATNLAIKNSDDTDLIFVCGSFHTIQECLEHLTAL